jgi:predicted nuclease of predicted toxin-antitoxin system
LRFLVDENVPLASLLALRAAGHDTSSVREVSPGAADLAVLAVAVEESRIVVTFDRDFGALVFSHGAPPPPGVIYLRFVPSDPEEPYSILSEVLGRAEVELIGRFTVVDRDRVRQRKLPFSKDV